MQTYEIIKMLRIKHKISQGELAKKVGYSDRSSIAKIESGNVDLTESKIKTFANVFGVSPAYLLGMTDAPAPQKDERIETIIKLLRQLPPDRQDYLIGLIEFELSRVNNQASDPASR